MRKVLVIGPVPPPFHGVSVATDIILNSEIKENFQLIHLDTTDRRSLENIGRLDVHNIILALKHFLKLIVFLIKEHPKVVYIPICQTVIGYLRDAFFIVVSRVFGTRVIVHLHGGYFRQLYEKSGFLLKMLVKISLKLVSKVIVLANCLRYIFEGLVPAHKIAVVSNGIDDPYKEKFRNKKYDSSNPIKILYLSNLIKEKGYIDVLCSIPDVINKNNRVKFLFAGDYRREKDKICAEEFIREKTLEPYVNNLGTVKGEKKYELLLNSDIFVLPSFNEGMPFAIIEAMSAGLPIITTGVGAIKEMVIDGENGFIVERHNRAQIAQKIVQLLGDAELRKRMGRKSRERFLKYYTKDRFIENLSEVFEEVLAE